MDRTLMHPLLLAFVTACAAGSSEPCAPTPPPAPAHSGDLVDTTEREAVSSKAPDSNPDPVPVASETPAVAPSREGAECVIPAKTCGAAATCRSLEELCHSIGDPIAKNDTSAFLKVAAAGAGNTFGIDEKEPEKSREAIEKKGGPRSIFGFAATGPARVTLTRDCTQCRRSFISYDIQVGAVTIRVMVDGGQITSWSKAK